MEDKGQVRKKIGTLRTLAAALLLCVHLGSTGCAGMPVEYNRNLAINSLLWGAVGSGVGAGVAAVTGNSPARGAVIGALGGAAMGALNTPYNGGYYATRVSYYGNSRANTYETAYWQEIGRLRREEYYRQQALETERGRNNARRDFYGQ
jgi:hypothetical protein